jgi:hypothetical protein
MVVSKPKISYAAQVGCARLTDYPAEKDSKKKEEVVA